MFRRTKLATKDLGNRIKKFFREQLLWHSIRNVCWCIYYGIFAYILINIFKEKQIETKYKCNIAGIVLVIMISIVFIVRIIKLIHSMPKGYMKIIISSSIYGGFIGLFVWLNYTISKVITNLGITINEALSNFNKFLILVLCMIVGKMLLLLADEFVFTGFRLAYEEDNKGE